MMDPVYNRPIPLLSLLCKFEISESHAAQEDSSLKAVINSGNLKKLQMLLSTPGIDVNQKSGDMQSTALHLACELGNAQAVKMLLKKKANINVLDKMGRTAMASCLAHKHINLCLALIKAGGNLFSFDKNGDSLLHLACGMQEIELVNYDDLDDDTETTSDVLSQVGVMQDWNLEDDLNFEDLDPLDDMSDHKTETLLPSPASPTVEMAPSAGTAKKKKKSIVDDDFLTSYLHLLHELIVEKNLSVNLKNQQNATPIYYAITADNELATYFLLLHHANLSWKNATNLSPLEYALVEGRERIVGLLMYNELISGMDNLYGNLITATKSTTGTKGTFRIGEMRSNLDPYLKLFDQRKYPLMVEYLKGNVMADDVLDVNRSRVISFLMKFKLVNASTPNEMFSQSKLNPEKLLEHENNAMQELIPNIHSNNLEGAKKVLKKKINWGWRDKSNQTCFHLLVKEKNFNMLKLVIKAIKQDKKFANQLTEILNVTDSNGASPLLSAVMNNCELEMIAYLVKIGADIFATNVDGNSLFHYAVRYKHDDTVYIKLLVFVLAQGVNVNGTNFKMETPLHLAVANKKFLGLTFLLLNKADPNVYSRQGYTPLHISLMMCNQIMVQLLIKGGADVTLKPRPHGGQEVEVTELLKGRAEQEQTRLLTFLKNPDHVGSQLWTEFSAFIYDVPK
eukprot:TRINITY_DN11953_c0_g1_i1.p1 TRINITY_DN11953_c0_g1~~TRINITY_DN11953_c0_g1_i1.p1  ORF type:complete len:770 (+),score=218.43 TRINITY_DN11953_c0_g1_i1:272-2311(+)